MPRRKRVDPRVPVSVGFTSQLGQVLASRAGKLLGISGPTRHWFPLEGGTHTFRSNREVFLKDFLEIFDRREILYLQVHSQG